MGSKISWLDGTQDAVASTYSGASRLGEFTMVKLRGLSAFNRIVWDEGR